jgi:hypothetical protein
MNAYKRFIEELRADPRFTNAADQAEKEFRQAELETGRNWHQHRFMQAVSWILDQPRTLDEKIEALHRLQSLPPGPRIVSLRRLTGWSA